MVETETKTASEHETWHVMTPEGVFDADLQTLKQWITEGAVHPTDKVRKGSLKWIDAGRAPMLRRVFNGEETPASPDTSAGVNAVAHPQTVAGVQTQNPAHAASLSSVRQG